MKELDPGKGKTSMVRLRAHHLMEKDVPFYYSDVIGLTLATAMINRRCGAIPIVDEQRQLVGIVTEFDVLNALMEGKDLERIKASEIMAREPKFVNQDTRAEEIIKVMTNLHLIHMPVVDDQGQLIGMIERSDILLGYLESKRASAQRRP